MALSYYEKLKRFPPVRCRLVAVRYPANKKYQWPVPLTDDEIATRSTLSVERVRELSVQTSWWEIPNGTTEQFLFGCRVDLNNWRTYARLVRLANREKYDYIRRHPDWATQFEPLVRLWTYVRRTNTPAA